MYSQIYAKIFFMSLKLKRDVQIMLISTLKIPSLLSLPNGATSVYSECLYFISFTLYSLCSETFFILKMNNNVH